jgi:putative heme iron utilization protein
MSDLTPAAFEAMISHMNDDHAEAVVAYARHFGGITGVDSARIASMDAHGIAVEVVRGAATSTVPIAFDHTIVDSEDGRNTLIAMYMQATAAAT